MAGGLQRKRSELQKKWNKPPKSGKIEIRISIWRGIIRSKEGSIDDCKTKKNPKRRKKHAACKNLVSSVITIFPSIFLRIISIKLFYKKYKMFIWSTMLCTKAHKNFKL